MDTKGWYVSCVFYYFLIQLEQLFYCRKRQIYWHYYEAEGRKWQIRPVKKKSARERGRMVSTLSVHGRSLDYEYETIIKATNRTTQKLI